MNSEKYSLYITPGDKILFERLYKKYYSSLVRFAEGILYDTTDAADIVQDVFVELWNKPNVIEIKTSIKSYLFSCVRYHAFSRIKKLRIIDANNEHIKEAYLLSMEYDAVEDDNVRDNISKIIDNMPQQMQQAVILHAFHAYKYSDIAEEMDISINTVKTHMKRAYTRFKNIGLDKILIYTLMCNIFNII